jgi:pimeloyl-ACP methyl ester carboxylesterase
MAAATSRNFLTSQHVLTNGLTAIAAILAATAALPSFAASPKSEAIGRAEAADVPEPLVAFSHHGPHARRIAMSSLCCDRKGNAIKVLIPEGPSGKPLPVVVWANGSWSSTRKYAFLLDHLASWGFLIVASEDSSAARGDTVLDALAALRTRLPEVRVDRRRVAAIGHSQGATGVMNAAIASPASFRTVVAVELPDRRFCKRGDCERVPQGLSPSVSALLIAGRYDGLSAPAVNDAYYRGFASLVKARLTLRDADHNDVQGTPNCPFVPIACRQGVRPFLPYLTAWLRWRLIGDKQAEMIFERDIVAASRGDISEAKIARTAE